MKRTKRFFTRLWHNFIKANYHKVIRVLRDEGYAVVIFNPEELNCVDEGKVEDRLVELGWEVIDCLS